MIAAMNRRFCKPSGLFFFLPYFFWRKKSNKKSISKPMLPPALKKTGKSCKGVPEISAG